MFMDTVSSVSIPWDEVQADWIASLPAPCHWIIRCCCWQCLLKVKKQKSQFDRICARVKKTFHATIQMAIKHLLRSMTKFREAHNCLMCSGSCLKQGRNWSPDFAISVAMRALRQLLRQQQSLSCITVSCERNFPEYNNDVAMTTIFNEWYRPLNAEIADVDLKNLLGVNFRSLTPNTIVNSSSSFFAPCFLIIKLCIDKTLQWTVKSQYVDYFVAAWLQPMVSVS